MYELRIFIDEPLRPTFALCHFIGEESYSQPRPHAFIGEESCANLHVRRFADVEHMANLE